MVFHFFRVFWLFLGVLGFSEASPIVFGSENNENQASGRSIFANFQLQVSKNLSENAFHVQGHCPLADGTLVHIKITRYRIQAHGRLFLDAYMDHYATVKDKTFEFHSPAPLPLFPDRYRVEVEVNAEDQPPLVKQSMQAENINRLWGGGTAFVHPAERIEQALHDRQEVMADCLLLEKRFQKLRSLIERDLPSPLAERRRDDLDEMLQEFEQQKLPLKVFLSETQSVFTQATINQLAKSLDHYYQVLKFLSSSFYAQGPRLKTLERLSVENPETFAQQMRGPEGDLLIHARAAIMVANMECLVHVGRELDRIKKEMLVVVRDRLDEEHRLNWAERDGHWLVSLHGVQDAFKEMRTWDIHPSFTQTLDYCQALLQNCFLMRGIWDDPLANSQLEPTWDRLIKSHENLKAGLESWQSQAGIPPLPLPEDLQRHQQQMRYK